MSSDMLKKIGLSHRVPTHVTQKDHKEKEEEYHYFILIMRNKIAGMDPDDVINMDQTSIPYSYHTFCILEKKGEKTIHVLRGKGKS
jgi:hypothetical protein